MEKLPLVVWAFLRRRFLSYN